MHWGASHNERNTCRLLFFTTWKHLQKRIARSARPRFLGLGSISRNGGFRGDNLKTYGGASDNRILLKPGDIYVSLKDVTQSADLLGAVARVPPNVQLGRLTQDTVKLVFKSKDAPKDYLYWLLQTPEYREYCKAHSTGTTNLGLPREDFLAFEVPPISEERRCLVELLQTLDDKIELSRRMSETLETTARAIFNDWFVDFGPTRAKMEGRAPYLAPEIWSLFPDRLDDQGKPEGWGVATLKEIASQSDGQIRTGPFGSQLHQADYELFGTPVVMPANLTTGEIVEEGIARIGQEMAGRLSDHAMIEGDIVYGRRGDIGRKALIGPDEAGWICGTGCLRISIHSAKYPPLYLFHHLDRPDIREWIAARAIGATMPNLNTGILGQVEVLTPTIEIANLVVRTLDPILQRTRVNRRERKPWKFCATCCFRSSYQATFVSVTPHRLVDGGIAWNISVNVLSKNSMMKASSPSALSNGRPRTFFKPWRRMTTRRIS